MKTVYASGSVDQIASDVKTKLGECTFMIYIADDGRFADISKSLHESIPNAKMIGTTGYMLTDNGSMSQGVCAVGFYDDEVEAYVGTIRKLDTCPIKYLSGFMWSTDVISKKYKDNLCIEFSTGHEEKVVSTMKICLEKVNMRLIGATSGNTTEGQAKKVACNGKVLENSSVYAVIGSKLGKIEIFKENLFHSRKKIHTVTKVSDDCRTIYEIDNRKAMDVYEEECNFTDSNVEDGVFTNPFARIVGTNSYICAIFSFDKSNRSINVYKNIQKNDLICFTDIDEDYKGFIKGNMDNFKDNNNIAGIFSVNCILRYLFFEKNNYTAEYARLLNDTGNGCHIGIIGDGEQYVEQHVNQSMVCAVFTKNH